MSFVETVYKRYNAKLSKKAAKEPLNKSRTRFLCPYVQFIVDNFRNSPASPRNCRLESEHSESHLSFVQICS